MKHIHQKYLTTAAAASMVLALSACEGPSKEDCHIVINDHGIAHSKQWLEERKKRCAIRLMGEKAHTHPDGTTHIHEGGDEVHYHSQEEIKEEIDESSVFSESDGDYSRESTTDYTEDDAEIIEWRKEQRAKSKPKAE